MVASRRVRRDAGNLNCSVYGFKGVKGAYAASPFGADSRWSMAIHSIQYTTSLRLAHKSEAR